MYFTHLQAFREGSSLLDDCTKSRTRALIITNPVPPPTQMFLQQDQNMFNLETTDDLYWSLRIIPSKMQCPYPRRSYQRSPHPSMCVCVCTIQGLGYLTVHDSPSPWESCTVMYRGVLIGNCYFSPKNVVYNYLLELIIYLALVWGSLLFLKLCFTMHWDIRDSHIPFYFFLSYGMNSNACRGGGEWPDGALPHLEFVKEVWKVFCKKIYV